MSTPPSSDLIIYGATAGGVMAALAAARHGLRVALLEPGQHVGGMVAGGLGCTDMDRQAHVIGGLAREFFERTGRHYGQPLAWTFEPHVAERILVDWLGEAGVTVSFGQALAGVERAGPRLTALHTLAGETWAAPVFIDASYEGDLMAAAGVRYTVGREGREQYGESLAGRQEFLPGRHQFAAPVSPYDATGRLLPYIVPYDQLAPIGGADGKFQSYCYRVCLTEDPANRLPLPAPAGYDPARFALAAGYLQSGGDRLRLRDFLGLCRLPNGKLDVNSTGPVSTDLLGANWDYPEASPAQRAAIAGAHLTWVQGLLYFLQNDPAVPAHIRDELAPWGLPRDEFPATGHWPHQLYIREGRRLLGEYVLTQADLQTQRAKPDSVGLGGYNIDIREVQWVARTVYRYPHAVDEVLTEGYITQPVAPYAIPYRALLPRAAECANLLVTACLSASTVAYGSARMEPQFMLLGHSAGTAAALAPQGAVHDVPLDQLQATLRQEGQLLDPNDPPAPTQP